MDNYSLILDKNGRILSAAYARYMPSGLPTVDTLPDGNLVDYRYVNGAYVYDPKPKSEDPDPQPTQEERIKTLEDQNETLLQCILEMSEVVYA